MKKVISILLAAALCLSIGASALAEDSSEEIDYTTGTPWMNIDLEGNVTADTPTDLKDNYALWAPYLVREIRNAGRVRPEGRGGSLVLPAARRGGRIRSRI